MDIIRSVTDLRARLGDAADLGFVPTMGNLHEGHLGLVAQARARSACVVASIFVNRLQFLPHEDFDTYPRSFERDCQLLEEGGCDVVFAPLETDLYPTPQRFTVQPAPELADMLEGQFRPGFFTGVCTVVLKLFNCVQPDRAYFGKKDYQQQLVVARMVEQLALPVEVVACETDRSADGLARSSRNAYLTPAERAQAPQLYRALIDLAAAVRRGRRDWGGLEHDTMGALAAAGWAPDYVAIRRRTDLGAPDAGAALVVLAAARLGTTRLIDNLEIEPAPG